MTRTLFCCLCALALCLCATSGAVRAEEDVLTNDTIIKLTKAGLAPSVITAMIGASATNFKTGAMEILKLNDEKVAAEVQTAMIAAAAKTNQARSAEAAANNVPVADPNDPKSPHDAGIYCYTVLDGQPLMTKLDPTVYAASKSSGGIGRMFSQGWAPESSKAVLASNHANCQVKDTQPIFYFYFEVNNAGLSHTGVQNHGTVTSPNEFLLVKFDRSRDGGREITVGSFSNAGQKAGTPKKNIRETKYETLGRGVYKVMTKGLDAGEYAFYYAGTEQDPTYGVANSNGGKVFDFGIDPTK